MSENREMKANSLNLITDGLPPRNKRVLAYVPYQNDAYGCWFVAYYCGNWWDDSRGSEELPWPTHWMELPPDPA